MRSGLRLVACVGVTALATSLPALAFAQGLSVTDVTGGTDDFSVSAPSVDVEGGNIDEATIRALFASGLAGDTAAALSTLDADSLSIPTLEFDHPPDDDDAPTNVVVTNIELSDVVDGVAGAVSIESIEMTGNDERALSIGPVTLTGFHIANALALHGEGTAPAATTPQPIYDGLAIEGMTLADDDGECSIEMFEAGSLAIRPLTGMSFMEASELMDKVEDNETPDPADQVELLKFYTDLLTAFETGGSTLTGLDCAGVSDDDKRFLIRAASVVIAAASDGLMPGLTAEGVEIAGDDDGQVSFDTLVIKPIDLGPMIAAVEAAGDTIDPAWMEANARKLIPAITGFSLSGLSVDVPDPETGARVNFTLDSADLTLGAYENGIPTEIGSVSGNLHLTVPQTEESAGLIALGYDKLDLDYELSARWDREASTIVIDRLAISEDKAAAIVISGTLGNATADLFADNPDASMAAATMLTVKDIRIEFTDAGLLPKLVAIGAAEQNIDAATFRAGIAAMAQGTVLMGLAGAAGSPQIAAEIAEFVNGAPHLVITATANDPAGLGMMDFQAAQADPTQLLRKVTLTAESDGTPLPEAAPMVPPAEAPAEPAAETETPAATGEGARSKTR